MKHKNVTTLMSILAAVCCAGGARAIVNSYALGFTYGFIQDSDAEPVGGSYSMSATIAANTDGDLYWGSLTDPNNVTYDMYPSSTQGIFILTGFGFWSSLGEFSTAFPTGTYHFEVTAGNEAGGSGDIYVPDYDFPNEVPYLTGGTWSALQMCPSGVDQPVSWNPFTHPYGSNVQSTDFYLYNYTAMDIPYINYGDSTLFTSDTIPGAAMRSGHYYAYNIWYFSTYHNDNQGFGGAPSDYTCANVVTGYFKVAANPGTISGQMTLDYDAAHGEPIEVIITGPGGVEDTQTITLGSYGWYAVDTTVTGQKTISFKGRHWLRKSFEVDLDTGIDFLNPRLTSGDIDNDNEVAIGDYAILSSAYNSLAGDPNYFDNADLNEDLEVNIGDFAILSSEYGNIGDD